MANEKDDFSDLGAVPAEDFSDLGAVAVEPEEISALESAVEGGRQGMTLGFSDEGSGVVGAGLDLGQQLLNKLGLTGPSPSQVSQSLAQQGVKGDLGPQDLLETYRQYRDEDRARMQAAAEANPKSFMAGSVAGGLATTPLMPAALTAPMQAAKGAGLATRMGVGAVNALPTGAIAGAGMSEADLTEGDIAGLGEDVLTGAGIGAGFGAAMPLAGAGINAIGSGLKAGASKLPETWKTAFKRGTEGVDVTSPEFYKGTNERLLQVVDETADPILKKIETQKAANAAKVAQLDDQINELNRQADRAVQMGEARQVAQNAQDINAINKETVGLAKNIQKRVFDVKKALGKQYDEIDAAAEATGIFPENRDIIGDLEVALQNNSGLPENEVNTILKKLTPNLGKKDAQSFRNLKQGLANYFEHANPVVRRSMKDAYAKLKNNYSNELRSGGYGDIADRLADTNKRWSAVNELEDQFLSNLKPNRVTGEIEPSPDTINAITGTAGKDAKSMANTEFLGRLMGVADPEQAAQTMKQAGALSERALEAKAFKPEVQQLPNPELTRLQNLLTQAKGETPGVIPGLDVNVQSPKALKDELTRLLPKTGRSTGDDIAEKRLQQTMDFLKQEQGPEAVEQLQKKLTPLAEDVELRNLINRAPEEDIPTSTLGLAKSLSGGAASIANKAGLAKKSVENVQKEGQQMLKNGIRRLTNATPEQIDELSARFATMGNQGAGYAKVLKETANKNDQSRSAIIFGLMQQPRFREMLREANGEGTEDETQ